MLQLPTQIYLATMYLTFTIILDAQYIYYNYLKPQQKLRAIETVKRGSTTSLFAFPHMAELYSLLHVPSLHVMMRWFADQEHLKSRPAAQDSGVGG